jgi:uncharacterized protein with GYD domain
MDKAAILVSVEPGRTENTYQKIKQYLSKEGVLKYSMMVYGVYDYLFIVETPLEKLQKLILQIRKIKGVKETVTLISAGE